MACECEILVGYSLSTEIPITVTPFTVVPTGILNGKEIFQWTDTNLGNVAIIWNNVANQWTFCTMPDKKILAYLPNIVNSDCPSFYSAPTGSSYTITELGVDENIISFTTYLNCPEEFCNCDITLNFTSEIIPGTTSILLTEGAIINGRRSYTFTQTFTPNTITFLLFWNETSWQIIVTDPVTPSPNVAFLEINEACPTGTVIDWQIEEAYINNFQTINTINSCEPIVICYSWDSVSNTFPSWINPWNNYTLVLPVGSDYNNFFVGQIVYDISSTNPFIFPGLGQLTVASLIFIGNNTVYHEPIYGAEFFGIVLKDEFGNLITPDLDNNGYICFESLPEPIPPTEDEINKECFDILVWNKQCEFSKCILDFLNKLQFGVYNCEEFEKLKNKKRALEILNCYDTQDIKDNTTDYNILTYKQIKKLLNY